MRTFSGKRSTLALAIAGITAMSGFVVAPQVHAEGFIDDSTLTSTSSPVMRLICLVLISQHLPLLK